MNIAIVGESDSGKATFLVLLFAAQIRYSEIGKSRFRFYIFPSSIEAISPEYNRMLMGSWPTNKLAKRLPPIKYIIGRPDDSKNKGFFNFFRKSKEPEPLELKFSIYELSNDEFKNVKTKTKMTFINLPEKVEDLLSSEIIMIIIDSSNLHKKDPQNEAELNSDLHITNTLKNIARYSKRRLYPVILFTKFDSINKKVLSNLKLPKTPPDVQYPDKRNIYGERLMAKYYPKTLKLIKKYEMINYEKGLYFFSSIKTNIGKNGKLEPGLIKSKEVGYALDFSVQEYIGLINYLEEISKEFENSKI